MRIFLPLFVLCMFGLQRIGKATLVIRQGRITNESGEVRVEMIPIVGIATIELGGSPSSRPTYYFECITNLNNGSGIRWTRMGTQHRFHVENIPNHSPGKRLNVRGIGYADLGVYICSDSASNDVISVNITGFNPAIMAVKKRVEVLQAQSAELEVYISGYPIPTGSQITWYHPNQSVIIESIEAGVKFQKDHKRLILSNIQPEQAGLYSCQVEVSIDPYLGAIAEIHLQVFAMLAIRPFSTDIIKQEDDFVYTVPLNYVGTVLVCTAKGWPIPDVEWQKDGFSLLRESGIISESNIVASSGSDVSVLARLTWAREFKYLDEGEYQCIVRQRNTSLRAASQSVELEAETVTTHTVADHPWIMCGSSITEHLVYFQIRIVGVDCHRWMKSQKEGIATHVHQELLDAVEFECSCSIDDKELQLVGVPQCSVQMDNAAMFHGLIQTNSLEKTRLIFCALSVWLEGSPWLQVDGRYQAVDSGCSIEASETLLTEECVPLGPMTPSASGTNVKETLVIAGGIGGIIMIVILLITIVCFIGCYCQLRTRNMKRQTDGGTNGVAQGDHTYDHIDFYSSNGPSSTSSPATAANDPNYSKLTLGSDREGDYAQPQWKDGPPTAAFTATTALSSAGRDRYMCNSGGHVTASGAEQATAIESGAESLYLYGQFQPSKITYSQDAIQSDEDQIYEQISNLDLQLESEEAQPYSEPVRANPTATK